MNTLMILVIMSTVIQFVIDRLKFFIPEDLRSFIPYLAMAFGVALSWASGIGLFYSLGIYLKPVEIDYAITGLAISFGSVALNELLKLVMEMRPSNQRKDGE